MQLTEDYTDFSLTFSIWVIHSFAQEIGKMLKTSKWDYENLSMVAYPFYLINWHFMHKTNRMPSFKPISMWKVKYLVVFVLKLYEASEKVSVHFISATFLF